MSMMLSKSITVAVSLSFLLFVLGLPTLDDAKPRPLQQALDPSIKSCRDLAIAESHLDAAFHTVTKSYETVPGQEKPIPRIEGVETPEKVQEFMTWYANGGHDEMFLLGQSCQLDIRMKSGDKEATEAGYLIEMEQLRNAEFFADKLMKKCTGKGLYRK
jgi:hypothetical protein